MKKIQLGIVCMLVAVTAMAEQITLTGVLNFSTDRRYYALEGCTPEMASSLKSELFSAIDMTKFSSGDKVKLVIDAKLRPDGKVSNWAATVISIEKAE